MALVSELIPDQRGGLLTHIGTLADWLESRGHVVSIVGGDGDAPAGAFPRPYAPLIPAAHRRWKEHRLGVFLAAPRILRALRIRRVLKAHLRTHDIVHYHGHFLVSLLGLPKAVLATSHDYAGVCPKKTLFRAGDQCDTTAASACSPCLTGKSRGALRSVFGTGNVLFWRYLHKRVLQHHIVVYVSEIQRQLWKKYAGVEALPGVVIPNPVPAVPARPTAHSDGCQQERTVLLASADAPHKGVQPFLEQWLSRPRIARVVVAGVGSQQLRGVTWLGWLDRTGLLKEMSSAHVFVVPSLVPETGALTAYESVLVGTHVAALARGALVEVAERSGGWVKVAQSMGELADLAEEMVTAEVPTEPPPRTFFNESSLDHLEQLYYEVLGTRV